MKNIRFLTYLFCGILILKPFAGLTQTPADYGFQQISNAPATRIYDMLIDQKGFIWIGHESGISRYDGKSFVSYTNEKRSSIGMDCLTEDSKGRIWCRNFNGQIFYIEDGKMKLLQGYNPKLNVMKFVIAGNELLAKCNGGLFVHNLVSNENKVIYATPDDSIPLNTISEIMCYKGKVFFLAHIGPSIFIFKYENGHFFHFEPDLKNKYYYIVFADDHHILLKNSADDSLTYFAAKEGQLIRIRSFKLPGSIIYAAPSGKGNKIWIHAPKKSILLNGGQEINNLSLTDYIEDREGNVWASSFLYGLLLKKKAPGWQLLPVRKKGNYITSIAAWNDKIIAGTSTGELLMDDTASFFKENSSKKVFFFNQKFISGLFINGNNLCAYGIPDILILNKHMKVLKRFKTAASLSKVVGLEDEAYVWAANTGMVALPAGLTGIKDTNHHLPDIIVSHFTPDKAHRFFRRIQGGKRVRGICYDPIAKTLYAGFSDGLYAFTKDSVKEIWFKKLPVYAYDIKLNQGKLYVATLNNGILILKAGQLIGQLNTGNGLSSSSILKLRLYGNHLWILGLEDIQLYDIAQKSFIQSVVFPPLKGIQVSDLLELNGNVYFTTTDGIYKIPLNSGEKKVLPLNYLLSVLANTSDTVRKGATLSYKKNSLRFNLAGLYYTNPNGVYFAYRLLGIGADTNWKYGPPGQSEILFPYIMPGSYTFEAVAHTANGLTAKNMIRFPFTINKPWWQQLWFILSIAAVICILSYVFIGMRIKARKEAYRLIVERLKHESERLEYENVANESELKALKSQMNPHFISNTLNTIQEMFMRGDKNAANEQLANFAILTRIVLTVSGKKLILLATEINILEKYLTLEKISFQDNFNYEIIMDEEIDEGYIQIPPMILQPFVENSVKHGLLHKEGEKHLNISFKATPESEYLICTIVDNGIGRAKAAEIKDAARYEHDSFSIEALRKRLDLMGKAINRQFIIEYIDLKDKTGAVAGTSVNISIPIFTT